MEDLEFEYEEKKETSFVLKSLVNVTTFVFNAGLILFAIMLFNG